MTSRRRILDIGLLAGLLFIAVFVVRNWNRPDSPEREDSASRVEASLPPPGATEAVELLKLIRPDKNSVAGLWWSDGKALVTPPIPFARLQVPVRPPEEYDLEIAVERKAGADCFVVGLAQGEVQFALLLDGWKDRDRSGLELIDRRGFFENETVAHGKQLPMNEIKRIRCSVRKNRVSVRVDDRQIIDWKADYRRVQLFPEWSVPDPGALFIGCFASTFRVHEIRLKPVSGQIRPVR